MATSLGGAPDLFFATFSNLLKPSQTFSKHSQTFCCCLMLGITYIMSLFPRLFPIFFSSLRLWNTSLSSSHHTYNVFIILISLLVTHRPSDSTCISTATMDRTCSRRQACSSGLLHDGTFLLFVKSLETGHRPRRSSCVPLSDIILGFVLLLLQTSDRRRPSDSCQ